MIIAKVFPDFLRRAGYAVLVAFCMSAATAARAQVAAAADKGAMLVSAGATVSGESVQYGERKMLGITGFVDADTRRRLGVEFEGRWLEFHQTANVHLETYSAGARYHLDVGRRFQPYVKGLIGFGNFNYSYGLATGHYLVVTAGGGLDFHLTPRVSLRAADFEFQDWPQFTFGSMSTPSVSSGVRIRIF